MDGEILTNQPFEYNFGGKVYQLKKANLKQVIEFNRKVTPILAEKDPAAEPLLASAALYIALHSVDPTVTEDWIQENAPGDLNVVDIIVTLGFMSQQKVKMMGTLNALAATENKSQPNGANSSAS